MTDADRDSRDQIAQHGLPVGLLPLGVSSATFGESRFEVRYAQGTERVVEGERVWYDAVVSGEMTHGRIRHLRGVKVKRVLWVPVTAITVDGDELVFAVGPLSDRLPKSVFG